MEQSSKALHDKNNLVNEIKKVFDKEKVEQLARETQFIQRERRLKGMDFFMLCLFSHQQDCEISLGGLANELIKEGVCITKQSLDGRFNEHASTFMKELLKYALSQKLNTSTIKHHGAFERIIAEDSTGYQLPSQFAHKYEGCGGSASPAGIKIHFAYDILSQETIEMIPQSAKNSDFSQPLGEIKKTTYV